MVVRAPWAGADKPAGTNIDAEMVEQVLKVGKSRSQPASPVKASEKANSSTPAVFYAAVEPVSASPATDPGGDTAVEEGEALGSGSPNAAVVTGSRTAKKYGALRAAAIASWSLVPAMCAVALLPKHPCCAAFCGAILSQVV